MGYKRDFFWEFVEVIFFCGVFVPHNNKRKTFFLLLGQKSFSKMKQSSSLPFLLTLFLLSLSLPPTTATNRKIQKQELSSLLQRDQYEESLLLRTLPSSSKDTTPLSAHFHFSTRTSLPSSNSTTIKTHFDLFPGETSKKRE